ncbi:hypothetical protein ACO0LF_18110 [Undibacterium sp. Di27W]|uniref:hypothetical protein n=1 Tax=Undibacterium sp. Di27W TaxID=3413036 RepID=UPI003BF0A244
MKQFISRIDNDVQDKNSLAWKKLCDYIDQLAVSGGEEFSPLEFLGNTIFSQIQTLPASIAKLDKVRKIWLYGSKLKRIPPEIGYMTSLEYFDPYTSYDLHWLPYEITRCKKLISSRISTRALYGNYKHRMGFPSLTKNPVRHDGEILTCSVCHRVISYAETNQLWISLRIGTDVVPLLVNACSISCEEKLPCPPENYVQTPHKGGGSLKQPLNWEEQMVIEIQRRRNENAAPVQQAIQINADANESSKLKTDAMSLKPLKLVVKIWDK